MSSTSSTYRTLRGTQVVAPLEPVGATMSSVHDAAACGPTNCVDGLWHAGGPACGAGSTSCQTTNETDPFLQVDLGEPLAIEAVTIHDVQDGTTTEPLGNFEVYTLPEAD